VAHYPIARLDQDEIDNLQELEQRFSRQRGRPTILIAYEPGEVSGGEGELQAVSSLVDDDPEEYGRIQAVRETGIDSLR
jgi:hypothetical protein